MNIKYFINYIRTQKCYLYFLIFQLILIIVLAVYVIKDFKSKHQDIVAMVLEVVVTAIVLIEIIIRMATQKSAYFKSKWNIIDLIGIIIIVILFIVFAVLDSSESQESNERTNALSILLLIRYIAQIIRVLLTIKENREMNKAVKEGVNLNDDFQDSQAPIQTRLSLIIDEEDAKTYKRMES